MTQVVGDLLSSAASAPWRPAAERAGLRASAAIPFACGGVVCATLSVYADTAEFFTPELVTALGELAPTVALARQFSKCRA